MVHSVISWRQNQVYSLKFLKIKYCMIYAIAGKRRALIPPEVGYVNEYLKPIPNEVLIEFPVDVKKKKEKKVRSTECK